MNVGLPVHVTAADQTQIQPGGIEVLSVASTVAKWSSGKDWWLPTIPSCC